MKYDVFISYRRSDGKDYARQVQLKLENYGYSVFLDVEELKDGVFDKRIIDAIRDSKVFIALLTPQYLCRASDPNDWVRKEIECAVDNDVHIVPINIDRLWVDFPEDCPSNVRQHLGQHQYSEIFTGSQFTTTMNDLNEHRLRPYIKLGDIVQPTVGATLCVRTDMDCRVAKYGEDVGLMLAGKFGKLRLKKGKHYLDFISTECPEDHYEVMYTVEDIDFDDFIEVKLRPLRDARIKALAEAEKARKEEEARIEKARLEEQQRREEEARKAEEARLEQERLAEQKRREEAARKAEAERLEAECLEKERLAEQMRLEQEAQRAEQRMREEEMRKAEAIRLEQERQAEQKRREEAARQAEAERLERERLAEQMRLDEETQRAERRRKAEEQRQAEIAYRAVQKNIQGPTCTVEAIKNVEQVSSHVPNKKWPKRIIEQLEKVVFDDDKTNNISDEPLWIKIASGVILCLLVLWFVLRSITTTGPYKVGDFYNENGVKGVVFQVWDDGCHGKIVSLDRTVLEWCTNGNVHVDVDANMYSSGRFNTNTVMKRKDSAEFPAFTWCRKKGKNWYLPAISELELLLDESVYDAVNGTLKRHLAIPLYGRYEAYWSSSEDYTRNSQFSWTMRMYREEEPKRDSSWKTNCYYVRAVAEF